MQSFENDAALDFTAHLLHYSLVGDLSLLREAFQDVFYSQNESYMDSDCRCNLGFKLVAVAKLPSLDFGSFKGVEAGHS